MNVILYIRLVLGILLLLLSLGFFVIEVLGVFKMKYVMNRMHSAAIGDALALGLAFLGLCVLNGLNFTTLKLLMVPCFMFISSPVCSHLVARLEVETTAKKDKFRYCNVRELDGKGEES